MPINNDNLPFFNANIDNDLINATNESFEDNARTIMSIDVLREIKFDISRDLNNSYLDNADPINRFCNDFANVAELCKYYVGEIPKFDSNSLSIFSHNINSLPKHYNQLKEFLFYEIEVDFDFICLCETKINEDIRNLYDINNYCMYNSFKTRNSGGLSIYINERYKEHRIRNDLNFNIDCLESLFVEVTDPSSEKNMLIGVLYRRPNTNIDGFFECLSNLIDILKRENKQIYLCGDLNLDLLKYLDNRKVFDLIGMLISINLICTISLPTRATDTSATLIDQLWTNNVDNLLISGVIHNDISDHFPIFSVFDTQHITNNSSDVSSESSHRIFSETNIEQFKNALQNVSWDLVVNVERTEIAYKNFELIFGSLYNRYFPLVTKKFKPNSNNKPYISSQIKDKIRYKNKLAKLYAKYPITYGKEYHRLRNKVTNLTRQIKS